MRILIADDEVAQSKTLRPMFAAGRRKTKVKAVPGAPALGQLIVARAPRKSELRRAKGRAAVAGDSLDLGDQP